MVELKCTARARRLLARSFLKRRDGRVAEGARLESVFRGNSNVGSNPTLSASKKARENRREIEVGEPISTISDRYGARRYAVSSIQDDPWTKLTRKEKRLRVCLPTLASNGRTRTWGTIGSWHTWATGHISTS